MQTIVTASESCKQEEALLKLAKGDKQLAVAQLTLRMAGEKASHVAAKAVNLYSRGLISDFGCACARALGHK